MKGRRQARRSALQALYELDQSAHAVEVVLAGRRSALYEAGLDSAMPPERRRQAHRVLAAWPGQALDAAGVRALAHRTGEEPAAVAAVAEVLNGLRPQAEYLVAIVEGVLRHRVALDRTIHRIAPEWPVDQMAPVDRNILRMALWEIGTGASPTRVAINEAVELARAFSGEGARRMVNGALGAYVAGEARLALSEDAACPS